MGSSGIEPARAGAAGQWLGAAWGHAVLLYWGIMAGCRIHSNLPGAPQNQDLLLLRNQAGSEGVLTE